MPDAIPDGPLVRQLRIGIIVNGQQAPGAAIISFTVNNDNFFTADTWSAEIALNGMPKGYGAPYWALQPSVEVSLLASLTEGGALTPVIGGMVDSIDINFDAQTMTISGRDHTAPLIDNVSNDKFTNQTSSQVVTTLAQRRGLTPQVTATSTPVGRYFNGQNDYMAEDITEWRVASYLAQQEGFDLYTTGKTLVFAPAAPDPSPLIVNYYYANPTSPTIRANVPKIHLKQKKVLAGPVTVQVRSWQYQNKQAIISTWQSQKKGAGSEVSEGQGKTGPTYVIRRTGLTQQQADQLAQKTLADVTSHEREVEIEGPGIIGIDARRTLRLTGTGTAFDQDYPIKDVKRTFGWEQGCTMTLNAKGSSPQEAVRL